MKRILVAGVMLGGCLMAVGCDTSAGTGSIGPSVTATHNYTDHDTSNAKKKEAKVQIQGPGAEPPK